MARKRRRDDEDEDLREPDDSDEAEASEESAEEVIDEIDLAATDEEVAEDIDLAPADDSLAEDIDLTPASGEEAEEEVAAEADAEEEPAGVEADAEEEAAAALAGDDEEAAPADEEADVFSDLEGEEAAEADEGADVAAGAGDDGGGGDDDEDKGKGDDEEEEEEEEEEELKPMVHWSTLVFAALNIIAVLGFSYVLLLDYNKRQSWSQAVFLHDLHFWGLPMREDADNETSGWHATKPKQNIDPGAIKKAFSGPNRGGQGSEEFQAVQEVVGSRVTPGQLSDEVLKEHFDGVEGDPVRTLDDEVERVRKDFPAHLEKGAAEFAGLLKTDAEKRKFLRHMLLPLASTAAHIDALDAKVRALKTTADLDAKLSDTIQRRMLLDVLRALEERKASEERAVDEKGNPAAREDLAVRGADDDKVTWQQLKDLFARYCDNALGKAPFGGKDGQESYEKRRSIAYLLLAVSQVRTPTGQLLYPRGAQRVAAVVGLHEYAQAAHALAQTYRQAAARAVEAMRQDRDGVVLRTDSADPPYPTDVAAGFVARHQEQVRRMVELVDLIKQDEFRLGQLREVEKLHAKEYAARSKHFDEVVARLLKAREETAKLAAELREMERQLFLAQIDLAGAAETNLELERQIREAERQAKGRRRP